MKRHWWDYLPDSIVSYYDMYPAAGLIFFRVVEVSTIPWAAGVRVGDYSIGFGGAGPTLVWPFYDHDKGLAEAEEKFFDVFANSGD